MSQHRTFSSAMGAQNQGFWTDTDLKLMDQVRQVLRYHHYALTTRTDLLHMDSKVYALFRCEAAPSGAPILKLSSAVWHLKPRYRRPLNAIVVLYKHLLDLQLADQLTPVRGKKRKRLPVVMSKRETQAVLDRMSGPHLMMAELMCGAGLRLMECVRLRLNGIDLAQRPI